MSDLPNGWCSTDVRNVTADISYGFTASSTSAAIGPRLLRITDIQDDKVVWDTVPYCECDEPARYQLAIDDIVVARTGATTGKSFLVSGEIPEAVFASYLIRLRANSSIAPSFLAWFMRSPSYWRRPLR